MHGFIIRHGECRGPMDPACTTPDSEYAITEVRFVAVDQGLAPTEST